MATRDRLRDRTGQAPPQDRQQRPQQGQGTGAPPNWAAKMIANAQSGKPRRPVRPVGPSRKLRPRPEQGAWESGYLDYLSKNRPGYEQQQQVNQPKKGGIEGWRETDYWTQLDGGQWNGTQITDPGGRELPTGALGWDYNAEPHWGGGWSGWLNRVKHLWRGDTQEEPVWEDMNRYGEDELPEWAWNLLPEGTKAKGGLADPIELGQNFSQWYRSPGDNWLETGFKGMTRVPLTIVGGIFAANDVFTTNIEQAQSATQAIGEAGAEMGVRAPTLSDVFATRLAYPGAGAWIEAKIPPPLLRFLNDGLEMANSVQVGGHIALSNEADVDDVWDDAQLGWNAGYTFYSQLGDSNLRSEMMNRIQSGEDPSILAKELENPWLEMGGRMLLDPFTYVGVGEILKIGSAGRSLKAWNKLKVAPEIMQVIGKTDEIHGVAAGAEMGDEMLTAIQKVISNHSEVTSKMQGMMKDIGIFQYTKSGKVAHVAMETGEVFRYIAQKTAGNPEDTADALVAMWRLGSPDKGEVALGLSTLADVVRGGSLRPLLAENGTTSTYFLRQAFKSKDELLEVVRKSDEGMEALIEFSDKKMGDALEGYFKTSTEIIKERVARGEYVSPVYKAAAKWHEATKTAYQKVNNVFSTIYMGYSPGFAAKNLMSNSFQMIVDQGPLAIFRTSGGLRGMSISAIDASTQKMLGWVPTGVGGFAGRTAAAGEDVGKISGEKVGIFRKLFDRPTSRAADAFESWGASQTVNNSIRETMETGLRNGRAVPTIDDMVAKGVPEDIARSFSNHLQESFGDVDAALDSLRTASKTTGYEDAFKDLSWVNVRTKRLLRDYDLHEDLVDIANRAESLEEAQSMWDDVLKNLEDMVAKTKSDAATMAVDGFETDATAEFVDAITKLQGEKAGLAVKETAKWTGQATNEAVDAINHTWGRLSQMYRSHPIWDKKLDDGRTFWHAMRNPWKEKELLREKSWGMSRRAWDAMGEIEDNPSPENLKKIWNNFGFDGSMPDGFKARDLKNHIWLEWYRPTQHQMYIEHRELYFTLGQTMMDGLSNVLQPSDGRLWEQAIWKMNIARSWDNVGKAHSYIGKAKKFDRTKSMNSLATTMLGKFGIARRSDSGNVKYLKNIMNAYGGTEFKNVDEMFQAFKDGKIGWEKMDDALIQRLVKHSGMSDDWESWTQIQRLTAKKVDDFLASDDVVWELVENPNKSGYFRMRTRGDSGRMLYVTEDWQEGAEAAKKLGVQNVLSDSYVGRKADDGTRLENLQKEWRKLLDIGPKEKAKQVAGEVEEVVEEVAEGFKLSYDWQPIPDGVKVPSIPGIQFVEIDGQLHTKIGKGIRGAKELAEDLPPIPYGGETPSLPRVYAEQFQGIRKMMGQVADNMENAWGKTREVRFNREINNALQGIASQTKKNVDDLRFYAANKANLDREFTLLNYGKKKNVDTILSQVLPYHFWYNRTYANWAQRVAEKPGLALNYHKWKVALSASNAGAPPWYRSNLNLQELGMSKNPAFLNIEATLSPLYGITGVDFDDPARKVNWWTTALDKVGKYGPSIYTPISWAAAVALSLQGEDEAAARWGGRMFPQSRFLKAGLAASGQEIKFLGGINEFDPMVHLFSGGVDPYERKRVGRYAATHLENRPQDEAAIQEALYQQSGPLWDEMLAGAQRLRAPGDMMGFLAGVGFKARSEEDMQIDLMDQEYNRMWANAANMTPEEMRNEYDRLREVYPFMDLVHLSRKSGLARDKSYAYSVLGRLPPGWKDDIFKRAGVDPELYQQFYDTKGNLMEWNESDRDRFMNLVVDLGSILDMPDDATREEWSQAQGFYRNVKDMMSARFGEDIHTKIGLYYDISGDKVARERFNLANPEVEVALSFKDGIIKDDPVAAQYYMSYDKLERYYNGMSYDVLAEQFPGVNWQEAWQGYNDAKLEGKEAARAYWKDHPELLGYIESKEQLDPMLDEAFVRASKLLTGPKFPDIREKPEGDYSFSQKEAIAAIEEFQNQEPPEASLTWEQWQGQMGQNLGNLVADYAYGERIPPQAMEQLENMADRLDLSVNVMLEYMAESARNRQY